jgi:3-methyladenine DNA glycosylase/8-oxoguanine DNA glycosylase
MSGHIADAHLENDGNFYSFPTPEEIIPLGVDGLFDLKTGFRAKYIFDAAAKVQNLFYGDSRLFKAGFYKACIGGIGTAVYAVVKFGYCGKAH